MFYTFFGIVFILCLCCVFVLFLCCVVCCTSETCFISSCHSTGLLDLQNEYSKLKWLFWHPRREHVKPKTTCTLNYDRELGNHYKLFAVPLTCSRYVLLRTYKRDDSAHCSAVFYTNSLSFFKMWYVIKIFPFQVGTEYLTGLRN